jgi:hypothetical protein
MYQSPVAAIAELVANAWDADAETVRITLPEDVADRASIQIADDGIGMTFDECDERYLNVGWNRRGNQIDALTLEKGRPVLGRKGIGKFAGFGIAKIIRVDTVSKATGERTVFDLDIDELRSGDYVETRREIGVLQYEEPDRGRADAHGTTISLMELTLARRLSLPQYRSSLARRFLLPQRAADFRVLVNAESLPEGEDLERVQFVFPRDYREQDRPDGLTVDEDEWGLETLADGRTIRWCIRFYRDPIDEEELRGISVLARGKLAQKPFFFNITGGLGGQHGQEYMSGQVEADYLDELPDDVIAPERQRVNWERPETIPLEEWGQARIKELLRIWRDLRGEARRRLIDEKVASFSARLNRLPSSERDTVESALRRLAAIPTLSDQQFTEMGEGVLIAWDQGRLRGLIQRIGSAPDLDEEQLLSILAEEQVLTALNTAEAVKTKLLTVGGLKERIERRELEAAVRDYIAQHPWLVAAEWETFRMERSVHKLMDDCASEAGLTGERWDGRVDLALSGGDHLVVLEFMRPGLSLDWDHLQRFEHYVRLIRIRVEASTGGPFSRVTGYIVADGLDRSGANLSKIRDMSSDRMLALDWQTLFARACAQWDEFLDILVGRSPDDDRLKALISGEPSTDGA